MTDLAAFGFHGRSVRHHAVDRHEPVGRRLSAAAHVNVTWLVSVASSLLSTLTTRLVTGAGAPSSMGVADMVTGRSGWRRRRRWW